jgi:hypothetical protein
LEKIRAEYQSEVSSVLRSATILICCALLDNDNATRPNENVHKNASNLKLLFIKSIRLILQNEKQPAQFNHSIFFFIE